MYAINCCISVKKLLKNEYINGKRIILYYNSPCLMIKHTERLVCLLVFILNVLNMDVVCKIKCFSVKLSYKMKLYSTK